MYVLLCGLHASQMPVGWYLHVGVDLLAMSAYVCAGKQYFEGDAGSNAGLAGGDTEMHPYVSFTISIENS